MTWVGTGHPALWRFVATAAAIIGMAGMVLHTMGRRFWCACGTIRPWVGDAWGSENSQHLVDPYSFTHVTHGVLLYFVLSLVAPNTSVATRALLAITAESGWEILENSELVINRYRAATVSLGYYGDSVVNSVGDILACAVGFLLASRLPVAATIVLTLLQEVALMLWIRDSLLINIVMLVHPIDAVKRWQLGG